MKPPYSYTLKQSLLLLLILLLISGCSRKSGENSYNSLGMADAIDGFLFNFDQREEVNTLVKYVNENQYPVSVTWCYGKAKQAQAAGQDEIPPAGAGQTEIGQPETDPTEADPAEADPAEADPAEADRKETGEKETDERTEENGIAETDAATTTDAETIRKIYYALSNTIILGVAKDQSETTLYYVLFTLPDGNECRFDFVSENTIRLSRQNYVAESDGDLWNILREAESKTD